MIEIMTGTEDVVEKEIGVGIEIETETGTGTGKETGIGTAIACGTIGSMVVKGIEIERGKEGIERGEIGIVGGGEAVQGAEAGVGIARDMLAVA